MRIFSYMIKKIKRFFHFHKWVYWVGKDYSNVSAAWNRGCRCGETEIAKETGNSFLYSEFDAKTRLTFKKREEHMKDEKKRRMIFMNIEYRLTNK